MHQVFQVCCILFYIYQFNQPGNKVKAIFNDHVEWISYSQERNYSQNGVVSGLMYNLKSPAVNRPDGYSKEKIQELFEKYSNEANAINSTRTDSLSDYNFVFVMNETFSDPLRIEGMSISEDPMPLYRELIKSNVSGQALSQGHGGGTANIEFEALTGISLEPLSSNITTPFVFCKNFLHNIAKKKYTPLRLKFFSDYFGLDRAFLSRKLSPVKLKMCA